MDLLNSGQKISIIIQKSESFVEISCSISKVLDDRIFVELPPYFMRYIEYLGVGCNLTVKAFSKFGTIDFNTVVISSPFEDDFVLEIDYNAMRLTPGHEIAVIQSIVDLHIKRDGGYVETKAFELSTEFLKFYSDIKYDLEDTFDCELVLPKNYGILYFRATVIEIDSIYDNEYKVSYSCMSEHDRQALLYYMYLYSNNSD